MQKHPEHQYLDIMRELLESGDPRMDRTGVGTLSLFGRTMRFDLSDGTVPIFTTKRIYWRNAIKEMLWFLSGNTNIQALLRQHVRIWTDWPLQAYRRQTGEDITREAFEKRIIEDDEFAARWGDIGKAYGHQWRHWRGTDGREHDQIATLVKTLREDPASRRMIFHAWNVAELDDMALPPCHLLYQFHVTSDGRLNGALYCRSQDVLIGTPFNVTEAAVLIAMLAQQSGLKPGSLVWFSADTHLYVNHIEQARQQIAREPRPFPTLRLLRHPESIDGYVIDDFEVDGYDPHPRIAAPVAV